MTGCLSRLHLCFLRPCENAAFSVGSPDCSRQRAIVTPASVSPQEGDLLSGVRTGFKDGDQSSEGRGSLPGPKVIPAPVEEEGKSSRPGQGP